MESALLVIAVFLLFIMDSVVESNYRNHDFLLVIN
jgi:hypothetical protein